MRHFITHGRSTLRPYDKADSERGHGRPCPYGVVMVLVWALWAGATTRHVPVEYPTIQSALNALTEGDTVLVDTGLYEEALLAPSIDFVLRGNVLPDTGDYPRPIVDPSSLPDPTHRSCLRQISGNTVIEDMYFRNRWPMHPSASDTGGGVFHPNGEITVRRCIFDSTFHSLATYEANLTIDHCSFRHISGYGPMTYQRLVAADCDLQSDMVNFAQMMGRGGSLVERCVFMGDHGAQTTLHLGGNNVVVRDCVFGPGTAVGWARVYFACSNSIFENNILENWQGGNFMYFGSMLPSGNLTVRNNVLRNWIPSESYPDANMYGFDFENVQVCDTCRVEFNNNVMAHCSGRFGAPGMVVAGGRFYSSHNRFTDLSPSAAVNWEGAQWFLWDNLFYGNQVALRSPAGQTDARMNWWGDPSGPYCIQNPNGLGDSISGNILFDPWYMDTTFFSEGVSPPRGEAVPSGYSLAIYPNPFNPVTELRFELMRPGAVKLELFNVMGQRVRELVNRKYERGSYTITFDGRELPSGIYFAHIRAGDFVKTQKLVLLK